MCNLQVLSLVVAGGVAVGVLAGRRGVWRMGAGHIDRCHEYGVVIYRVVHGVAEKGAGVLKVRGEYKLIFLIFYLSCLRFVNSAF